MHMVCGDMQSTNFGVRSLRRHPRNHPNKGRQGILTHSDDGRSKILTAFFLDIFETQGEIAEESFPVARLAMNNFLLAEMNEIYEPQNNELESVSSSLIGYPATIQPSGQINKMGTEMLMEVKMTFDNEPSPDISELEVVIREVMSDLSLFVTNLTRFGTPDFENVTEAYRREIPTAAPSSSLAPSSPPLQQSAISDVISDAGQQPADEAALTPEQIAVPAVLIGATFLAVILFLVVRRRRRSNPDLSKSGDQILTDIEGGGFSFDKSLDSSRPPSPEFPSSSVSELGSQDSVFSDTIADASKRLKPTNANIGASSQATVPSSNRMYNLLNFVNGNEDLYANGNRPTGGRPMPPASAFERDGSSSSDTSESRSSSKNSFADIAAYTARTADPKGNGEKGNSVFTACTSNGGGRDPTPRNSSLDKKTQSTTSGGLMNIFHCAPTEGALGGERKNQERVGRSPQRRTNSGNETQGIFRPRSRSGTPSKRRSGSQSRNSTPNRSRPSTPTTSRPSTPTNDRSRQASNSPSAANQRRATTPNRNRSSTPERRMGNSEAIATGQGSNGGSRDYARKPAYLPSNDPKSQRHPFQDVNLRKPDAFNDEKKIEEPKTPDRKRPVFIEGMTHEIFYPHSGRRHAGNNGVDGSAMYQANAMDPSEWSYKSYDNNSVGNSTISDGGALPKEVSRQRGQKNGNASKNGFSTHLEEDTEWIEKRIAAAKQYPTATPNISIPIQPQHSTDSLSYASNDNDVYQVNSPSELYSSKDDSVMSSIVCRDCYAPPGKLNIVIHSTKDGPAVHTVKSGSSLEGHIFPGDLIISVDNVDTRSFTAEHVMKMMAAKSTQERKITVLHFEEESQI